jgi:hypothetical protein
MMIFGGDRQMIDRQKWAFARERKGLVILL